MGFKGLISSYFLETNKHSLYTYVCLHKDYTPDYLSVEDRQMEQCLEKLWKKNNVKSYF